jgi:hypothetical protein
MQFEFFKPTEAPGLEFIRARTDPFGVFRAFKFENEKALEAFIVKYNILNDCVFVDHYNILICYVGTVNRFSTAPVLGHNVPQNIKASFPELKSFYEKKRIKGNETRNKKFARR